LINSPQVNHYVDVTDTFEVAALRRHQSQTGHRPDPAATLRAGRRELGSSTTARHPAGRHSRSS
jgi:LmbE family N-acetylglucosaminyl deacetylase